MASQEQLTVLLTTHYLEEADHLADRLVIVDHGRVVAEGTPEDLKSGLRGDAVVLHLTDPAQVPRALTIVSGLGCLRDVTTDGRILRARADVGAEALPAALAALDMAACRWPPPRCRGPAWMTSTCGIPGAASPTGKAPRSPAQPATPHPTSSREAS